MSCGFFLATTSLPKKAEVGGQKWVAQAQSGFSGREKCCEENTDEWASIRILRQGEMLRGKHR